MPKKAKELGPLAVSRLTDPGLHFVGGVAGLALQVLPSGGRTWVLRATMGGKRRDMGLGGFPDVTLADARSAARKAREKIREGLDPIIEARTAASANEARRINDVTFEQATHAYVAAHEAGWRNAKQVEQWRGTLETYAFPVVGPLIVKDVGLPHILTILEPIWKTKTETGTRLRGRLEQVLDWATARGYREGPNPARWRGHLDKLLARPAKVAKVKHRAALPFTEIGAFMQQLRAADGMGARALEFAILTAARSGEVRGATWSEIDLNAKIWTIPAARTHEGKSRAPRTSVVGCGDPFDDTPSYRGKRFGLPSAARRAAVGHDAFRGPPPDESACRAARLPLHVSGLGRREDRLPSRRRRDGAGPHHWRQGRSSISAR